MRPSPIRDKIIHIHTQDAMKTCTCLMKRHEIDNLRRAVSYFGAEEGTESGVNLPSRVPPKRHLEISGQVPWSCHSKSQGDPNDCGLDPRIEAADSSTIKLPPTRQRGRLPVISSAVTRQGGTACCVEQAAQAHERQYQGDMRPDSTWPPKNILRSSANAARHAHPALLMSSICAFNLVLDRKNGGGHSYRSCLVAPNTRQPSTSKASRPPHTPADLPWLPMRDNGLRSVRDERHVRRPHQRENTGFQHAKTCRRHGDTDQPEQPYDNAVRAMSSDG